MVNLNSLNQQDRIEFLIKLKILADSVIQQLNTYSFLFLVISIFCILSNKWYTLIIQAAFFIYLLYRAFKTRETFYKEASNLEKEFFQYKPRGKK